MCFPNSPLSVFPVLSQLCPSAHFLCLSLLHAGQQSRGNHVTSLQRCLREAFPKCFITFTCHGNGHLAKTGLLWGWRGQDATVAKHFLSVTMFLNMTAQLISVLGGVSTNSVYSICIHQTFCFVSFRYFYHTLTRWLYHVKHATHIFYIIWLIDWTIRTVIYVEIKLNTWHTVIQT